MSTALTAQTTDSLSDRQLQTLAVEAKFAASYDEVEHRRLAIAAKDPVEKVFIQKALARLEQVMQGDEIKGFIAGAGTGREVLEIANLRLNATLTVNDIAEEYLHIIDKKVKVQDARTPFRNKLSLSYAAGPIENLLPSQATDAFNLVTAFGSVCNYSFAWQSVFNETARMLSKDGMFLFSMLNPDALIFQKSQQSYEPSVLIKLVDGGVQLGPDESLFLPAALPTINQITDELESAGLSLVATQGNVRLTGLFPNTNAREDIATFRSLLRDLNPTLASALQQTPDQALFDRIALEDLRVSQSKVHLSEFAYISFLAVKK